MNAQVSSQLGSRDSSLDNILSTIDIPSSARTTKIESGSYKPTTDLKRIKASKIPVGGPNCNQKKKVHFGSELSKCTPHLPTKLSCSGQGNIPLSETLTQIFQDSPSKSEQNLTPFSVQIKDVPKPKSPVFKEPVCSVVTITKELEVKSAPEVTLVPRQTTPPQSIEQTDRSTPLLKSNQISFSREDLKNIVSDSSDLLQCHKEDYSAKECYNTSVSYVPVPYPPSSPYALVSPYFYPMILTPQTRHLYLTAGNTLANPSQATQTSVSFEEYCRNLRVDSKPMSILQTSKMPVSVNKSQQSESIEQEEKFKSLRSHYQLTIESTSPETNSHRTNKPPVKETANSKTSTNHSTKENIIPQPTHRSENLYHCHPVSVVAEPNEPLSRDDEYYSDPPPVNYSTLPRSIPSPSWQEIFDKTPPLQLPDPSSSMESALSIDPIVGSRVPSARPSKVGIAFYT